MASEFIETEEILETRLVALVGANVSIPVEGFLAPTASGTEKRLAADTFVSVLVDLASQDGDYVRLAPFTYTAKIAVHYALADDPNGASFRAACRAVRAALLALCGDGCSAFDGDTFACCEFTLDSSSSSFEGGDNPVNSKSYTATIKGRTLNGGLTNG